MKLYISEDEIKQALKLPDNIEIRIEGYSYGDEDDAVETDEEIESEADHEDTQSDAGGEDTDSKESDHQVRIDSTGEGVAPTSTTKKSRGEGRQDKILRMYLANKDIDRKYIAEQLGCSVATVYVTISQYNTGKITGPAVYPEDKEIIETEGDIDKEEQEGFSEEDEEERDLADKVRKMWSVEGEDIVSVSQDLGISIERCNEIILKYRIKKETFI